MTLNEIQNPGFWIVMENSVTRDLICQCVTCKRFRGKLGD